MTLKEFFSQYNKTALAFSGGTDSAYLLYAASKLGADVKPYFVMSQFQPEWELNDALHLSSQLKIPLNIIMTDVLAVSDIAENPQNRCYHCKKAMFSAIKAKAEKDGYDTIIDGTNLSDSFDERPGMRAISEIGVLSPLRICGISKAQVRKLSADAGLFTADKPSYSCLATRIKTGERITEDKLKTVEQAEKCLASMGFSDFRVRLCNGGALIEFKKDELQRAHAEKRIIENELAGLFEVVSIDPEGR